MATKHPFLPGVILTRHHIHPKVRGGPMHYKNILRLWDYKHHHWHCLFFNLNISEILFRLDKLHAQKGHTNHWKYVFKETPLVQVRQILIRVKRIKNNLKKRKKQPKLFDDQQFIAGSINWQKLGFDKNPTFIDH